MARDMMRLRREVLNNTPHEESASGAVASFKTDVPKLKECVVNIEPVQEGSGDPSPDNVRPISGWSEAKVYDDPKYGGTVWWNQLFRNAPEWIAQTVGTRVSISDGVITAKMISTGAPSVFTPGITITGSTILTTIAKHKYYMACKFNPAADGFPYVRNYTAFPTASPFGTQVTRAGEWGSYENIISATATGGPALYLGNGGNTSQIQTGDSFSIKDLMCIDLTAMFGEGNEPATVADFRAMFPNDYYAYNAGEETLVSAVNGDPYRAVTIDLDGTRYGGTVDVLTGVLTVDRAEVDLGTLTWSKYTVAQGTLFRASISDSVSVSSTVAANAICSAYPVVAQTSRAEKTLSANLKNYDIINSDYSTAADFKTAMSGVQLVYELAEPFTVQLTPARLRAICGQNNIFATTGDTSVKYWKHGG